MNSGTAALIILVTIAFLFVLRWSHRCWGKAILSALFAPIVAAPIAAVAFLAIALVLRLLNGFLSGFGVELANSTLQLVAMVITSLLVLFLAFLYCREQRRLSLIETGPQFGQRYQAPSPRINQKGPLR